MAEDLHAGGTQDFEQQLAGSIHSEELRARLVELNQQFNAGEFPPLEGGFRYIVYDGPVNPENGKIPIRRFAECFDDGAVPVVPEDNPLRAHDLTHVDNYAAMMRVPGFADIIKRAAAKGIGEDDATERIPGMENRKGVVRFGSAVDDIGDALAEQKRGILSGFRASIIREQMSTLVEMGADPNLDPMQREEVASSIWNQLGLPEVEADDDFADLAA